MARRTRRNRRRDGGTGLKLVQIVGLGIMLLIILLFRDQVADNAGKFFGVMGSEDVRISAEGVETTRSDSVEGVDAGPEDGVDASDE